MAAECRDGIIQQKCANSLENRDVQHRRKVRRAFRIQSPGNDPETRGNRDSVWGAGQFCQTGSTVIYHRIHGGRIYCRLSISFSWGFQFAVQAQMRKRFIPWSPRIQRCQFLSCLPDNLYKIMVKERVIQDPSITFLSIRDFAISWADFKASAIFIADIVDADKRHRDSQAVFKWW